MQKNACERGECRNDMITQKRWDSGENGGEMIRSALRWVKNPERKARLYRVALVAKYGMRFRGRAVC